MQGGPEPNPHSMMTTVKHWPSQGAGGESALQYDAVTIKYHMKPWQGAIDANAISVMPGYNSCPFFDNKGANSSRRANRYLRNDMKFNGFVVTDWLGANTNQSIDSMGAGIDVLGGAPANSTNMDQLAAAIGMDRINESCRRILDMKIRLGLFENPYGDPTCKWTNAQHHAIALEACKKSITLLKNDGVLPLKLKPEDSFWVGGPRYTWSNKDNDPNVIWQSIYYDDPQQKDYMNAISARRNKDGLASPNATAKVAIVVIGEKSYTHGTEWADKNPNIPAEQIEDVKQWHDKGLKTIVVVICPRPYVLTELLPISDAILLVYRGGTAIEEATAGLIFGDYQPSGKLPFQLPKSLAQLGADDTRNMVEKWDLPYDFGASEAERTEIRSYIAQDKPVPPIFGDPLFQYGFGLQNFTDKGGATAP
jgi:beta-glucosidase